MLLYYQAMPLPPREGIAFFIIKLNDVNLRRKIFCSTKIFTHADCYNNCVYCLCFSENKSSAIDLVPRK